MQEFNVDVATNDGAMDCFIVHPEGAGPFAPIILYMDVPGIREELRDFARHIAKQGYLCVLPDLYYREGKVRFDLSKGESELKKMFAIGGSLSNAMIMIDTQGMLDYLSALDIAREVTGTIGYCLSGQFIISAAGTFPDRIKASASLYGTRIVTEKDDSPHALIPTISGELYLGFAEHDHYVEDFVAPTLQKDLDAAGKEYLLETFAGTEHGFCFPQRPQYSEADANTVWDRVFAMYARQL